MRLCLDLRVMMKLRNVRSGFVISRLAALV
jgi:hypothetical protein